MQLLDDDTILQFFRFSFFDKLVTLQNFILKYISNSVFLHFNTATAFLSGFFFRNTTSLTMCLALIYYYDRHRCALSIRTRVIQRQRHRCLEFRNRAPLVKPAHVAVFFFSTLNRQSYHIVLLILYI